MFINIKESATIVALKTFQVNLAVTNLSLFYFVITARDVFRTQPNNYNRQLTIFLDVWLGFKYASDLIYVLLNFVSCFDVALLWKTFSLFNHILDDGIEKVIVFYQLFYINTLKYSNFHHYKLDIPRPTLMVISRLSS